MTSVHQLLNQDLDQVDLQVCSKCIYDERVSYISFDEQGVCNYCRQVERLAEEYGTGQAKGEEILRQQIDEIKRAGKNKKYDCIVGVSGGTDSSYMLHLAREWGLRPLAVHYDNTWNTATATMNIERMLRALDIDLHTHVVDNKEMDDIFRAFFLAGVPEIDAPTDLGFAYLLRKVAAKYSIKYILEGHSFIAEGITPLGRNYFDGKYIQSIHQRFGRRKIKTYPLMTFARFLISAIFYRVQFIRPYWYMSYNKEDARELLMRKYGWEYYGGHHLENRMPAYYHSVYLPEKFNTDMRNNTLSARVRMGSMTRSEAWAEYNQALTIEPELVSYVKKRLDLDDDLYASMMKAKPKSWLDYPTYKKRFEKLRPLFYILAKANLVTKSFYLKYCFPLKTDKTS